MLLSNPFKKGGGTMSLTLAGNKQVLVGGDGTATIHLDNGSSISIEGFRTLRRTSYLSSPFHISGDSHFFVTIGQLPSEIQAEIRADINKRQQQIHENAPEYRTQYLRGKARPVSYGWKIRGRSIARQIPVPKPPASIDIYDDYKLVILNQSTYNGHACLEVGKPLVIFAKRPYDIPRYTLGTIIGFTLT
jgi:hypothetical protein